MAKPKKQIDEAAELSQALGLVHKDVTVRGESVRVEEFELEQLPVVIQVIRDLVGKAGKADVTDAILMQSGEAGIRLAMLATGKDREWFRKMPLGDGLALYAAIIEVNQSFFDQSDQIASLVGLFAPMIKSANGFASSDSLPATDTPSPQSEG